MKQKILICMMAPLLLVSCGRNGNSYIDKLTPPPPPPPPPPAQNLSILVGVENVDRMTVLPQVGTAFSNFLTTFAAKGYGFQAGIVSTVGTSSGEFDNLLAGGMALPSVSTVGETFASLWNSLPLQPSASTTTRPIDTLVETALNPTNAALWKTGTFTLLYSINIDADPSSGANNYKLQFDELFGSGRWAFIEISNFSDFACPGIPLADPSVVNPFGGTALSFCDPNLDQSLESATHAALGD